jgi:hypothetical protein
VSACGRARYKKATRRLRICKEAPLPEGMLSRERNIMPIAVPIPTRSSDHEPSRTNSTAQGRSGTLSAIHHELEARTSRHFEAVAENAKPCDMAWTSRFFASSAPTQLSLVIVAIMSQ